MENDCSENGDFFPLSGDGAGSGGWEPPRAVAASEGGAWGRGDKGYGGHRPGVPPNPVKWPDGRCGTGAAVRTTTGRCGAMGTSRPTATGPHHGARAVRTARGTGCQAAHRAEARRPRDDAARWRAAGPPGSRPTAMPHEGGARERTASAAEYAEINRHGDGGGSGNGVGVGGGIAEGRGMRYSCMV